MIADFPAYTIDVESYRNFFCIGLLDTTTGETRWYTSELGLGEPLNAFCNLFTTEKFNWLWIGFNSCGYDNHMIRAVLDGQSDPSNLHALSQTVISQDRDSRDRRDAVDGEVSIDLYAIFGGKMGKVGSLKELAAKIGYPYLQELPYHWDAELTRDQMTEVMQYNRRDLEITARVADIIQDAIAARIALSIEFGVRVLNKHDPGVAEALMAHRLFGYNKKMFPNKDAWHLDCASITHHFTFQHAALIELHDRVSQWKIDYTVISKTVNGEAKKQIDYLPFSDSMKVGDVTFNMGVGGLHSKDEPAVYLADEDYCLLDLDVASFYPSIIINHRIVPPHLPRYQFITEFSRLRQRRLDAKQAGQKALSAGLKIAINSIFGKAGSAYGWLSDPTAMHRVTILGQLTLLAFVDLVAACEDAEVISANTDGLTLRIKRQQRDAVVAACNRLAEQHNLALDWVEFKAIYRCAVNAYIAVKLDGSLKTKSSYAYDLFDPRDSHELRDLERHPVNTICVQAVQQFFVHQTPLEDTIRECRDLRRFVNYYKVSSKNDHIEDDQGHHLGRITRWYLATGDAGCHLDKVSASGKRTQLVAHGAKLVMELPTEFPADIDYPAYVAIAEKLVLAILEPEVKISSTIPIPELSSHQRVQLTVNADTITADGANAHMIDMPKATADWVGRIKGNRYDTIKSILVRAWIGGNGQLTRGDLLWLANELDDGYFAENHRTIDRMAAWISREISPFKLPQTHLEMADRAITWAKEHVEAAKRKRKMHHRSLFDSTFISGEAIRKFDRLGDSYKLACAISAAGIKHGCELTPDFICGLLDEAAAFFSKDTKHETV